MHRRHFLQAAASLPLLGLAARAESPATPTLIERMHAPQNLEMNFAGLTEIVTPTSSFYVRNHFAQPKLDTKAWRLKVEGAVEHPIQLSLDEVRKLTRKRSPDARMCGE